MALFSMLRLTQWMDGNGEPTREFYRFVNNLFHSTGGGGAVSGITVGSSPFVYTAPVVGQVVISGGTVSKIEISRDVGTTFFTIGLTSGMFLLKEQDELRVTYSAMPTMTFIPA